MNEFDVVFDRLGQLVLDENESAHIALEPSAEEIAEIELIRSISADIVDPAPSTYTASRAESAELTVHFRHIVE